MSKQTINLGSVANDGTGDSLRAGGDKINDNFTELYDSNITISGVKTFLSYPISPNTPPTTDYQFANKKYVDDNISGGSGENNKYGGFYYGWKAGATSSTPSTGYFSLNNSNPTLATSVKIHKNSQTQGTNLMIGDMKYLLIRDIDSDQHVTYQITNHSVSSTYYTLTVNTISGGGTLTSLTSNKEYNVSMLTDTGSSSSGGQTDTVSGGDCITNTGDNVDAELSLDLNSITEDYVRGLSGSGQGFVQGDGSGGFKYGNIASFGFVWEYLNAASPTTGKFTHDGLVNNITSASTIKVSWTESETSKEIEEYLTVSPNLLKIVNMANNKWHLLSVSSDSSGANFHNFSVSYVNGTDTATTTVGGSYIIILM